MDKCAGLAFGALQLTSGDVSDPRLIAIDLDEHTILWRSADIEQERRIAIFDLLEGNIFAPERSYPCGYAGPYKLMLRVEEGRLAMEIARADGTLLETIILSLGRFRKCVKDYFAICDSYFGAIKAGAQPAQIETIDMARRGVHNEAAELLKDALDGKVTVDFDTARRLFTLICVLHIKG